MAITNSQRKTMCDQCLEKVKFKSQIRDHKCCKQGEETIFKRVKWLDGLLSNWRIWVALLLKGVFKIEK